MAERKEDVYDIIIVGAGLSGLSAAREALKCQPEGLRIAILEGSSRVGGRTYTDKEGTDFGGTYIGPTQDRIMRLVDELGLKVKKTYTEGRTTQYLRGKVSTYEGMIPKLPLWSLLDLNAFMVYCDKVAGQIDLRHPEISPDAETLDRMTFEEFLRSCTWTSEARSIVRVGVQSILGCDPAQVSALAFVWYVKSSGGVKRIFETKDGAQDSKVVGGTMQISEKIAAAFPKGVLRLSHPVHEVDYTSREFVKLSGNMRAKTVIFAMPPMQIHRVCFSPPLAHHRAQSLQRWIPGLMMKTFMYYKEPFWRKKGLNGIHVADRGISLVTLDDTREGDNEGCLMGFIYCDELLKCTEQGKTPDDRRDALVAHYVTLFGPEALHPIRYKEKNWLDASEEPFIGGVPAGICSPGVLTKYKRAHMAPLQDRMFFAATESAVVMQGYMDGAVEAGERCARNALCSLGMLSKEQAYDKVSAPTPSPQMPFVAMELSFVEKIMIPSVPQALLLVLCSLLLVLALFGSRICLTMSLGLFGLLVVSCYR